MARRSDFSGGGFDPNTFKADITAEVFSGYVRIKFKKGKSGGINLYSRLQGQTAWKFVSRDTNSPYDDHTPLAVPNTPRDAPVSSLRRAQRCANRPAG